MQYSLFYYFFCICLNLINAQTKILDLPAIVDLDILDSIRDNLIEVIELLEQGSLEINAQKVERVATNALLMLLSTARTAEQEDVSFFIKDPSTQMLNAINRLGLDDNFTPLFKGQNK